MLLFWPLVIPFATAVLCVLAWRSAPMQRGISLAGAIVLFGVAVRILVRVAQTGPFAQQAGGWPAPFGITMVADWLSAIMVVLVGLVAVAVLVFGIADVTAEEEHHGHHPLTHAMLAGICGAFLTGDIFNMYVWFEVMLISSFGLLVIGGGRDELDGAMKYVGPEPDRDRRLPLRRRAALRRHRRAQHGRPARPAHRGASSRRRSSPRRRS